MVIYETRSKCLEAKLDSNGNVAFYLTREDNTYKMEDASIAVAHVVRNFDGARRIHTLSKLMLAVTVGKILL